MDTSLIARGGVSIQLDRERIVFFNMVGLGFLHRKYGMAFWRELYVPTKKPDGTDGAPLIKDMETLQFFLWAGLQVDAQAHGETLTLDQVADMIFPMTVSMIANAVSEALTFQFSKPEDVGKAEAAAASPADAAPHGTGQTASTTPRPRSSRSASSAGRPPRSSRRRSPK